MSFTDHQKSMNMQKDIVNEIMANIHGDSHSTEFGWQDAKKMAKAAKEKVMAAAKEAQAMHKAAQGHWDKFQEERKAKQAPKSEFQSFTNHVITLGLVRCIQTTFDVVLLVTMTPTVCQLCRLTL